jgi:hypothetical protein
MDIREGLLLKELCEMIEYIQKNQFRESHKILGDWPGLCIIKVRGIGV